MKIVIPMAGTGQRFVDSMYKDPKPLIKVNGRHIIDYIVRMFDRNEDDFIFLCNDKHLANTDMMQVLMNLVPKGKIVSIPAHKKGPVFTLIDHMDLMEDDEQVIVTYCDNPYLWDYKAFKKWVKDKNSDGVIMSHTGFHPHRLSTTMMAYMKQENGIVTTIKEKECYTDNPMEEHASTGTYYFGRGAYIKKYFRKLMDENITYNGEYYVTLVYNLMIRDGLLVHSYLTDFAMVFGTPEEVENFEAWQTILRKTKNEEDALKCYRYWRKYNEIDRP